MMQSTALISRLACDTANPLVCYRQWRANLKGGDGVLLVDFTLQQYWLVPTASLALTVIYCVSGNSLRIAVTDQSLTLNDLPALQQYEYLLRQYQLPEFDHEQPLQLLPEIISKPWGREIWYSGIEQRGVCQFSQQQGGVPIPWLQAVVPGAVAGPPDEPLLLLKILDPLPEPERGDLYFELHQHKREVYLVTHVDSSAWPDGVGRIRYGFNRELLAQSRDEAEFRAAYLAAVQAYESVRKALDGLPAGQLPTAGDRQQEQDLREQMHSFTHQEPVAVGDVITVPSLLPHSLQHGVRVIEVQTPVYERKILSFGQRVLTQDHWDTSEVIGKMRLYPPPAQQFSSEPSGPGVGVETIAGFPDFSVSRVKVESGANWRLVCTGSPVLAMVVSGVLRVGGADYSEEQAILLPGNWSGELLAGHAVQPLVLLVATADS